MLHSSELKLDPQVAATLKQQHAAARLPLERWRVMKSQRERRMTTLLGFHLLLVPSSSTQRVNTHTHTDG